jgi:hypothetical protein
VGRGPAHLCRDVHARVGEDVGEHGGLEVRSGEECGGGQREVPFLCGAGTGESESGASGEDKSQPLYGSSIMTQEYVVYFQKRVEIQQSVVCPGYYKTL